MRVVEGLREGGGKDEEIYECFVLLRTIIGNARNLPDQKYQSVKMSNKKFERLIRGRDGAVQILEVAGFVANGEERMVLSRNDPGLLYLSQSLVDLAAGVVGSACARSSAALALV